MRKLVNSFIKKIKHEEYEIDDRIPTSYLFGLVIARLAMAARGSISRIKHKGYLFIAGRVTVKARTMFRTGRSVSIGNGCFIDALSTDGVLFGDNVSMGRNVRIECTGSLKQIGKGIEVGNNVGLGADCFFGCAGGIIIGDDTIMGNYVSFHSENHLFDDTKKLVRLQGFTRQGIKVGKNCWIGSKATILDGADIGDGCIIAAGAVVIAGSYEANGIYAGIPAKLVRVRGAGGQKEYEEYIDRLSPKDI